MIQSLKNPVSWFYGVIPMKKVFMLALLFVLAVSACSGSASEQPPIKSPVATQAPSLVPLTLTNTPVALSPTETPIPAPSFTATLTIYPVVTFAQDAICRTGPAMRYYRTGSKILKDKTFQLEGRNVDSSWIAIPEPGVGDYCWVPFSSLGNPGDISAVYVFDVQPLPNAPINVSALDGACGHTKNTWLTWYAIDGTGYYIYRNGKQIGSSYEGHFRDLDTPQSKKPAVYLYEIEAYNASGVSERSGISVTICD
jgi:hypothetical protein